MKRPTHSCITMHPIAAKESRSVTAGNRLKIYFYLQTRTLNPFPLASRRQYPYSHFWSRWKCTLVRFLYTRTMGDIRFLQQNMLSSWDYFSQALSKSNAITLFLFAPIQSTACMFSEAMNLAKPVILAGCGHDKWRKKLCSIGYRKNHCREALHLMDKHQLNYTFLLYQQTINQQFSMTPLGIMFFKVKQTFYHNEGIKPTKV